MNPRGMTYKDAGVDISAGNQAVAKIKSHVANTWRPGVLGDLGGFGGLFALDIAKYRQPVLVSGTDGVGTKLKIAHMLDKHDTIGIDAVAMCVNDILVHGAEPLFFLDYLAVGKLEPDQVAEIVKGVAEGCIEAGCALIGGETAEMPGFYGPGEYDIAGFAVGVADKDRLIDGSRITSGDQIIGLASSGMHSNGFSLARKVLLEVAGYRLDDCPAELNCSLGEELLKPTRIYVKSILPLLDRYQLKGLAHITGGGFIENIPRILPHGLIAEIKLGSWPVPPIFALIQHHGQVAEEEMYRTFNMGIGMVLVLPEDEAREVLQSLAQAGEQAYLLGEIKEGGGGVKLLR